MAASSPVRSWRTAFLTLRDETLVPLPRSSLPHLLRTLLFSQSEILIAAAPDLPPHEVTLDVVLLLELVASIPEGKELADMFIATCNLVHNISCRVCLEMSTSSRVLTLDFLEKMVHWFLHKADLKTICSGDAVRIKATKEILEIVRNCSFSENTKLVKLLLKIISCLHAELTPSSYSRSNQQYADNVARIPKCYNLWEVQTDAFVMIGDILSEIGSSIPMDIWQSTLEILRKVMDVLASRSLLVEDNIMSRFYTSLLHCLHLVLSNPKGSLSEHVAGFVASLQMFFMYGLTNRPRFVCSNPSSNEKEFGCHNLSSRLEESSKSEHGPYRPPHLRKRVGVAMKTSKTWNARSISSCEASACGISSSDSEHSDNDGSVKGVDQFRSSRARIAAIFCIQDLCQADPKSLSAHWTMLLPTGDVLQMSFAEAFSRT